MKLLKKIFPFVSFLLFYFSEMVKANLQLARDILSPNMKIKPGIVRVNIGEKTDNQILVIFNLITMTPGSMCMELSENKKTIYVHGLYVDDSNKFEAEIQHGLVRKVMEVFK